MRLATLFAILLLLALDRIGLPGAWLIPILSRSCTADLLRFRRLHCGPLSGLRISEVTAQRRLGNGTAKLYAAELRLRMLWRDSVRTRSIVFEGGILDGHATWHAPGEVAPPIRIDHLQLRATPTVENALVIEASAKWGQVTVLLAGHMRGSPTSWFRSVSEVAIRRPHPTFVPLAQAEPMMTPRPIGPGVLRLHAELNTDRFEESHLRFDGEGCALEWIGRHWAAWTVSGRVDTDGLQITEMRVHSSHDELRVRGRWAGRGSIPEFAVDANLSPAAIRAMRVPEPWNAVQRQWSSAVVGPIRASLAVGPRPNGSFGLVQLKVEGAAFSRFGVTVRSLSGEAVFDGTVWRIRRLLALVGDGATVGPLAAMGLYEPATRRYELRADACLDPTLIRPLIGGVTALHLGSYRSLGRPPHIQIEAAGFLDDPASLCLNGRLSAVHFTWNGAFISSASACFRMRSGILNLDNVTLIRPDGWLTGRIEQDFERQLLRFETHGSLPIPLIARLAGPRPHLFISQFHFSGRATISSQGQIDYARDEDNWGDLHIVADHIGYSWLDLRRVHLDARVEGRQIHFDRVSAAAFDGSLHGSGRLQMPPGPRAAPEYEFHLTASNLDFADLLRALTDRETQTQRGRLSGWLRLSGRIGRGQGPTAIGEGYVRIRRGQLLDIALFGGLSRYLSTIVPGLGFVSQGDLRANFLIRNGYLETERAELRGDILSLEGMGRYYFDQRLQFRVEARLLRSGAVADLVRLLTSPVTRLFEFDLGGTLNEPEWAPRNLPRM